MSKKEAAEPRSATAPTPEQERSGAGATSGDAPPEGAVLKVLRAERLRPDPSGPSSERRAGADKTDADAAGDGTGAPAGERQRLRRKAQAAKDGALDGAGASAAVRERKGKAGQGEDASRAVFVSARAADADPDGRAGGTRRKEGTGRSADDEKGSRRRRRRRKKPDPLSISPPKPGAPPIPVMPPAPAARRKKRHVGVMLSFVLFVILPVIVAGWYLYERAADQYASNMGFSVRKEESANAAEVIGGIVNFGSGNTSDSDILYEFIQSQALVERVDQRLDLRSLYSKPDNDPVFSLSKDAPIETLVRYWRRMVTIYYDGGSGLIETRVLAFTPEDAQLISQAILEESTNTINKLTKVAREDATRYARDELALAEKRLRDSRAALTEFRARTQIVDPSIDVQGQMGLLTTLQGQLAEALIELDLLLDNTREGDPRIRQAEQRISVIENRIAEERKKFGIGETSDGEHAYASLVGEYESLIVDREFAEQSYLAARANLDAAQAEAQRQTRYLAAYTRPTLAQSSEYPQRSMLLGVFALFALVAWSVGALIYYSVRDRR